MATHGVPTGHSVIDLTFLNEKEELAIRAVLEKDFRLQQAEEARLKSKSPSETQRRGSVCARCGECFGWIFNTGALCPTCSERVCKRDRVYKSYSSSQTWMCTLCEKRMRLQTNQEVFSWCSGLSNGLQVSKDKLERHKQLEKEQQDSIKQQQLIQERKEQELQQQQLLQQNYTSPSKDTSHPASVIEPADEPDHPQGGSLPRLSPVLSKGNLKQSLPVVTQRHTVNQHSSHEQLPSSSVAIVTTKSVSLPKRSSPVIAPYPPRVMAKTKKSTKHVQGELYLKVYLKQNKRLVVKVDKATGLAAAYKDSTSDPYAMIYILPDHRQLTKEKTRVALRTTDPDWDMYYYESPLPAKRDLTGKVLWVSIWDWNRFSKAEFLGEVMVPLWTMDLHDHSIKSYPLQPKESVTQRAGELRLSLRYEPPEEDKKKKHNEGRLHVHILEAKDLFYDNSYVKCFLRPCKQKAHRHKETDIITQPKCPVYDEKMIFEKVTMETLSTSHVLEVTVWDAQFIAYPMGVARLGPKPISNSKPWMDSQNEEVSHWEAMLSNPNQWKDEWHLLRPDADFRDHTQKDELTQNYTNTLTHCNKYNNDSKMEQLSNSLPKPVVVYSASKEHFQANSPLSTSGNVLSSEAHRPIFKGPSDKGIRKMTAESTILNRDEMDSRLFLTDSKKKYVPVQHDENNWTLDDPRPRTDSNSSGISTYSPVIAPYPPRVMAKTKKSTKHVQGEVYLKVYLKQNKRLVVKVDKATGLAAAYKDSMSDPYAMIYILPDHRQLTKEKTRVALRTTDPDWDMYYYESPLPAKRDLTGKVLWVSIWDWNRFSKAEFLGEVMLPLWTMDLHDHSTKSYPLQPKESVTQRAGELRLSLLYEPPDEDEKKKHNEGRLHVHILEAKDLFYDNSYVKCFLRPGTKKAHRHQETDIITQPKCPVYDEKMIFEKVTMETLSMAHVLEVTVWDAQFIAYPMGVARLGPQPTSNSKPWMDSQNGEVSHWEAMLSNPNQWSKKWWHVLRPDADFRDHTQKDKLTQGYGDTLTQHKYSNDNSKMEQLSNSLPRPVVVVPATEGHGQAKSPLSTSGNHLSNEAQCPIIKHPSDKDVRKMTAKNTTLNCRETDSSSFLNDNKKHVLAQHDESHWTLDDPRPSNSSCLHVTTPFDMQSVYSGSVIFPHEEVTGEIQMGVSYSDIDNILKVSINKVRGLTPPNKVDENNTNPYVKTYLLPDRSKTTKKKTSVKKGVDPIFNETIKYPIKRQELSKHTLKVGVWHNDFWRDNLFLGEVTLPLDEVDWSNPSDKWYGLEEPSYETGQPTDRGQLKVTLQFNITSESKQSGDLVVTIISGHHLLQEKTVNPFVMCSTTTSFTNA